MKPKKIAVLFLNGEINTKFCQKYIEDKFLDSEIFCADGAYDKIKNNLFLEQKTIAIIGDGDSISEKSKLIKFILRDDQNYTDFEKILIHLVEKKYESFFIFGSSGGEMDHFLSNMSIALSYKQYKIIFIDEYSYSFFIPKNWSVDKIKNHMVSVVPFPCAEGITYDGLQYKLNNEKLKLGARTGIRNYAIKDNINIKYKSGNLLVFISNNPINAKQQKGDIHE